MEDYFYIWSRTLYAYGSGQPYSFLIPKANATLLQKKERERERERGFTLLFSRLAHLRGRVRALPSFPPQTTQRNIARSAR